MVLAPLRSAATEAGELADAVAEPVHLVFDWIRELLPGVFFEVQVMGLALWQWLALITVASVAALISWVIATLIVRAVRPLVLRSDNPLDDELLEKSGAPLRLAILAVILRLGIVPIGLPDSTVAASANLFNAMVIVALTWLLSRATDALARHVEGNLVERGQTDAISLVPPGRKAVKAAISVIAFVAVLDSFGFSVTALVAGLGVGGIAVALAAQKTVENLFGGFTLYADRPVRVGDFCRFGDQVGTVEEIGLRSTRVRTLDRTLVSVPNSDFSAFQLENYTARDRIRFFTVIGLRYETTPEQLRHVLVAIRRLLYAHERVTDDPARIRFVGFGAYSLDLEIFAYVDTQDWNEFLGIREDLLLRIMDLVEASGTGFAFPSQTLYLGKDGGLPEEQARRAKEEVAAWRERGEIFLPDFPAEKIAELDDTIGFPPEGSPGVAR